MTVQNYGVVFYRFCELIREGIIKSEKFTKNFFDLVVKSLKLSLILMRGKISSYARNLEN